MKKIADFFLKHKLFCILLMAFLFRVFLRGSSAYGVTGELYRDMLVELNFERLYQWPLLGPSSSLGGFNFGAVYYYILYPVVKIFNFAPYGAALVSLTFSLLSIWSFYKLMRLWFVNEGIATFGALFLALSVFDIQNSYYVSNPNLMPFFILLFLYCLTKICSNNNSWVYYFGLGLSVGISTQLHATALFLLPCVLIFSLVKFRVRTSISKFVVGIIPLILVYTPYVIYELMHDFINTKNIFLLGQKNFSFFVQPSSVFSIGSFLSTALVCRSAFFDFVVEHTVLALLIGLCFLFFVWFLWFVKRGSKFEFSNMNHPGKGIFYAWIIFGLVMFLFYQREIQFFYFFVLWPAPIVALAWLTGELLKFKKIYGYILIAIYISAQFIQLVYFYPGVYVKAYDHKNLLEDFNFIQTTAGTESFNVINKAMDVNQFLYYLELTRVNGALSKIHAQKVFLICNSKEEKSCTFDSPLYIKVQIYPKNGLFIIQYNLL